MKDFFNKVLNKFKEMDTKKQILVLIGVFVAFIGYLYVVGLIAQRIDTYLEWLYSGGLISDNKMKEISYNLLDSIAYVGSLQGLKWLIVVSIVFAILIMYIMHKRSNMGEYNDDRGFVRSKSNVFGSAHLLTDREIRNTFDVDEPLKTKGIILGAIRNKVVCLKDNDYGNKNIAIFGSSGTGKSRAIIRNQLFQKIRNEESIIVTDPKGELFADTKTLFENAGYHIRVLNIVNMAQSDGWNCMDALEENEEYVHTLAASLIMNSSDNGTSDFWDNGAENLLKALILYVATDENRTPEEKNLAEVYNMLMDNTEKELDVRFSLLRDKSLAKRCYGVYASAPDNVRQSVYSGLGTRLKLLQSEEVQAFFASSDIDLTLPAKRKCIYYVICSDTADARSSIISLFFTSLMNCLLRYADKTKTGRCDIPVNFIMDEFNNIGKLGINADGSDFCKFISVCRSRNISVTIAMQGLGQLKNRYPQFLWSEILSNCRIQLLLGCADEDTAKYFSEKSGDMTVEYLVNSKNQRSGDRYNSYGESKQYASRKLYLPNELMELKPEEMLCFCTGVNVMKLKKFDYSRHPIYQLISKTNANEYFPNRKTGYKKENSTVKVVDDTKKQEKGITKIVMIDDMKNV